MKDSQGRTPEGIAKKIEELNSLPKSDQGTHDRLLQEVNGYFQDRIKDLKTEQAQAHARHEDYDLRGNIIAEFQTVKNYIGIDKPFSEKPPINIAYFDFNNNGTITEGGTPQYTSREQPLVPTCFQISDADTKLSFTINTDGKYNADFLYQAYMAKKTNFPYKSWSQYWGGRAPSAQPYQPSRLGKTKYEL
ncbi:MAG: hypothetical protein K2Y22_07665 [Candidatus Obscuribacterales bacterium]|nr:hypothetical protein [Candidatus Obscuribacterales bacterium]